MANIFHRFETSSREERELIARNLAEHYNRMLEQQLDFYEHFRECGSIAARIDFLNIDAAIGHVQSVFNILGIEYEPGQAIELYPEKGGSI